MKFRPNARKSCLPVSLPATRNACGEKLHWNETTRAYSQTIQELLKKPWTRAYKYPIFVKMTRQGDESYPDVSLLNTKAVPPPKGKRPWGGKNPAQRPLQLQPGKVQRLLCIWLYRMEPDY